MNFQSTRRDFLQAMGTGAAGLVSCQFAQAETLEFSGTIPAVRNAAKHLILLNLSGGPSHIDTFDPKPAAAAEYRNFDPACQTAVSGVSISENLPRLAARLDEFSLIRSLHHNGPATHEAGLELLEAGHSTARPSVSWDQWVAQHLGSIGNSPTRMVLGPAIPRKNLSELIIGRDDVSRWQSEEDFRSHLGAEFENQFTREHGPALEVRKRMYGTHALGLDCLRARMLIEAGVRVVVIRQFSTVYDQATWDMHANGGGLRSTHDDYRRSLCPQLDQALSALLDDLRDSGKLAETLVVAVGEMGRTPRINCYGGRDHHTGAWTGLIAGGPIRNGTIVGATDALGDQPRDRPVRLGELGATICYGMGLGGLSARELTGDQPIAELI